MSQKYEISLKKIEVYENGMYETGKKASNFFEALLFYPKAGTPSVRSILELKLIDNQEFFQKKLNELSEFPENLNEEEKKTIAELNDDEKKIVEEQMNIELSKMQILFKQEFESDSTLEFNLSSIVKVNKLESALLGIIGKITVAAIDSISGIGSVIKAAATVSTESIFGKPGDRKNKLKSIGRGLINLDENMSEGEKNIDLLIPQEIEIRPIDSWNFDGSLKYGARHPITLKKWKKNGSITIKIKKI